jgi:hypothetical protein
LNIHEYICHCVGKFQNIIFSHNVSSVSFGRIGCKNIFKKFISFFKFLNTITFSCFSITVSSNNEAAILFTQVFFNTLYVVNTSSVVIGSQFDQKILSFR